MQPKHRAAKTYQLQRLHQMKREESPKLCNNQEVNTVTAEVSSGEDTNAEDIGTPQTKITETSLQKRFKCEPKACESLHFTTHHLPNGQ